MAEYKHEAYNTDVIVMYRDGKKPTQHYVQIKDFKFELTKLRYKSQVDRVLIELNLCADIWRWVECRPNLVIGKGDTIHLTIDNLYS
jgi:hypothetical protein